MHDAGNEAFNVDKNGVGEFSSSKQTTVGNFQKSEISDVGKV